MNPVRAHALAIAATAATALVVSAAWIFHLRQGPRLDGFTAGPMVLAAPVAILILTLAWLVLRALVAQFAKLGAINAFVFCAAASYIILAITCGPIACFQPGPNRLLGWFVIAGVALSAFVHHVVLARFQRGGDADTST